MFMALLDSASKKEQKPENFAVFMKALIQGYNEGLGLLGLYAVENGHNMILTAGSPDKKILNFLTNRDYYYKIKKNMPAENREKVNVTLFSCREIINKVIDDETIAGIIFNATESNRVIIEKEIFTAYLKEGLLMQINE